MPSQVANGYHATVSLEGHNISVSFPDDTNLVFSNFYLRDHCACPDCRHPDTKQRLVDTFSIPENITANRIEQSDTGLTVSWSNDDHRSFFSWGWLKARNKPPQFPHKTSLWGVDIARNLPEIRFTDVMESDAGVQQWTSLIREWGFCFVDGCPVDGESTQKLLERLAFIRHTHYGGFWQFTADLGAKDSAYTDLALGAHTDNTYFTDPAGLQMLHLLSHTDGDGGASLLVDGFKAAEILQKESPELYKILCEVKVRGHASGNEKVKLMTDVGYPVFGHIDDGSGTSTLRQIRWNNDDRAALFVRNPQEAEKFYAASRKWVEILQRSDLEFWQQLKPGKPVIFDNWRVLHGRSAFSGRREMCGGYINMDDFISRWKTLNFSPEDIINSV